MKIGILSDTHGYMDERILHHLEGCAHIIHAGDLGAVEVLKKLEKVAPTTGVYGNIDGTSVRALLNEVEVFSLGSVRFLLIHIAGVPGNYNAQVRELIAQHKPNVLVCGHSHLLKVQNDSRFHHLHINPGAAGRHGLHQVRTLITLEANDGKLSNMNVVELGPRSAAPEGLSNAIG